MLYEGRSLHASFAQARWNAEPKSKHRRHHAQRSRRRARGRFVSWPQAAPRCCMPVKQYNRVRLRMRQVEASAKSITKLVMQIHPHVPQHTTA